MIRVVLYVSHSKISIQVIPSDSCNKMVNNPTVYWLSRAAFGHRQCPLEPFGWRMKTTCSTWSSCFVHHRGAINPCHKSACTLHTFPHISSWQQVKFWSSHYSESLNVRMHVLLPSNPLIMCLCFRTTRSHSGTSIQLLLVSVYSSESLASAQGLLIGIFFFPCLPTDLLLSSKAPALMK